MTDIRLFIRTVLSGAGLSLAALAASSCDTLPSEPRAASPDPAFQEVSFGLFEEPEDGVRTRTLLGGSNIESKNTCITLAAYTGGKLYGAQHYTSSLTSMDFNLRTGDSYDVYALVNMGDMTAAFGADESSVASIRYSIPSYTGGESSVNTAGMPKAGFRSLNVTASTTGTIAIPVKRLLSKVTASLACHWDGAVIRSAKVCNMNRTLSPFSGAMAHGASRAAVSPADILPFQEIHGATENNASSLTATFYVPENMQGTVPGITSSSDKCPDGGNPSVSTRQDVLTYLEVFVESSGNYGGSVTYRSYLGNNATSNFDLARNTRYDWTVDYFEDGLLTGDWKKEGDLTDNRYLGLVNPIWVEAGDEVAWNSVISSNIANSSITKTFGGGNAPGMIASSGTDSFSISPGASAGQWTTLTARPVANVTASLTKSSEVRVVDKALSWEGYNTAIYASEGKKVFPVTPEQGGATVNAQVDYYGIWSGSRQHFPGEGAAWTYTSSPQDGVSASYAAGEGSVLDRIAYRVMPSTPPGDYPVTVSRTKAGKTGVHDDAFLRVADTRYLRWTNRSGSVSNYTSYSYSADEVHAYCVYNTYASNAGGTWYQPLYFEIGDASGANRILNTHLSSSNIQTYVDILVSENGDGSVWTDMSGADCFEWYNSSYPSSGLLFIRLKQSLSPGVYGIKISFKDGSKTIVNYLHVTDAVSKELVVEPSPADVVVGGTVQLHARLYDVVNGVRSSSYVDRTTAATFTVPYDGQYLSHEGAGLFRGLRIHNNASVYASLTEGGVTYNANSSTTRGVVNIISDYVVSYGVPVVSLSYTPDPIGHEGGSSVPSLSVSQGVTYASGATGTLSSGYTAFYSGSAAGFSLNASTGLVSALSNEGAETVSYGTPVVSLSYNGSPIACTGGSATPTVTYSQTKTTTRSPSSPRTLGVTVTVSMNGQSATASGSVTQSGDNGATSSETLTAGGTVSFSGSATGFTLDGTTGVVTASANEGATATTYSTPVVTLSYAPNTFGVSGGTAVPTLSYNQDRILTRGSTSSRTIRPRATVSMNGKTGQSAQVTVTQSGDTGGSTTTLLTSGGTVSWHMNAVTGFTLHNSSGNISVAQNNTQTGRSTQAWATVSMNGKSGDSPSQTITQNAGVVTHSYTLVYLNPYGTSPYGRAPLEVSYCQTLQVKLIDQVYVNGVLDATASSETVLPNGSVSWSSTAPSRASVTSSGVVTGLAAGTVEIDASYTPSGESTPATAKAYLVIVGSGMSSINNYWTNGGSTTLEP